MTAVAIALGSNLGNRAATMLDAVAAMTAVVHRLRVSSFHETAPVDMPGSPAPFLNAAAVGETALSAGDLLDRLLAIELDFGRQRPYPGASRTLDLDLILYGVTIIDQPPRLVVPHPRFRERWFVLDPLAEIAPDWIDPATELTVSALRKRLHDGDKFRNLSVR